jgi:3-isopropylmalate/(R)-2-methylmalate dehydratase small subunit
MQPFTKTTSVAAPLPISNVDTDVIIPIRRLISLPKEALGPYAFEALRYKSEGIENPDFVLNQPAYRGAQIIVAGPNFGCGSSREGAVWALVSHGIRCVIASGFGDIFYDNCFQNGLLPVRLPLDEIDRLMIFSGTAKPLLVDLVGQTVTARDHTTRFAIDAWRKKALLLGLDGIQLTLRDRTSIESWQENDRSERAWAWLPDQARSS